MESTQPNLPEKSTFLIFKVNTKHKEFIFALFEILAILLWAMWVGYPYLNTSTYLWPAGGGMGTKLLGHHFWTTLQQCGTCALWNGTHDGGRPAMADLFGSQFHPLVMVTTLLWGVIGGAKIAIIAIMTMAGIAQWWIAKILKLGRTAGLWSAFIAVAGGNLITKNNEGNFGLMLATASCCLAIAALLGLAVNRRRKDTIILAVMGALVLLSGQGYMQLTLLAWAPALLFFLPHQPGGKKFIGEVLIAVVLGVLIAGFVIVPIIHFWPNLTKDTADPNFPFSQPLEYIPLNLVIRDLVFFADGGIFGKQPYTDLQFIGWIPVLLALLCLRFAKRDNYAPLAFFASGAFLSFFIGSAIPLRFLSQWFPFFLGFRFTSPMPGLAVPAVLALAAFSLDYLLKLDFPKIELATINSARMWKVGFDLKWLIAIVLLVSIQQVYDFSTSFIGLRDMKTIYQGLEALKTPQTEWVSPPGGETDWVEPAINSGLKITNVVYSGAYWAGRNIPAPYLVAIREGQFPDSVLVGDLLKIPLYRLPANEYAYVQTSDGKIVACQALAKGGNINVTCPPASVGTLIVREYSFDGWNAWADNAKTNLLPGPWLSLKTEAGEHSYKFAYQPWDVIIGLLISIAGIIVAVILWFQPNKPDDKKTLQAATHA